ncbi:helix-turn-helix transcriptional regulator [Rhodococcus sp. IEGM 1408]|uniref:helix-turn-helix transcriptional regulator n=1 Tax=Rhodococcus sp. IEGM 1408 TaxID=3082220 RepID=UPI002954F175|nr:WYL domain-containing protein [Rhodococcus sp. IEGM 1408]MDV8000200.1 WYL domain-containing protein [Rhodococcus sp. IEGM 1408]
MSTSKSQRLVNLVICLRSTNAYLSAGEIRRMVQGYDDCENEAAYLRMFERDKRELREVGVPLDQGASLAPGSPIGYRIPAQGYELPEITLTPEQAGVLAVAAEVWREGERAARADGALAKLTAAGIDPVHDAGATVSVEDPAELAAAAVVAEAVAESRLLTFSHTPAGATEATPRRIEPWWTGSRQGNWYVVGHDLDRGEPRTFRLIRISGLRVAQAGRTAPVPPTAQVLALLDDAITRLNPVVEAGVWAADGHAAELRAMAREAVPVERFGRTGADLEVSAPLGELSSLVASQSADAVALRPAELRVRVVSILTAAEEAVR